MPLCGTEEATEIVQTLLTEGCGHVELALLLDSLNSNTSGPVPEPEPEPEHTAIEKLRSTSEEIRHTSIGM